MKAELVAVARIASPHGVRGEVKLLPLTDFPHRFENTASLHLADGSKLYLETTRFSKNMILAKFKNMDTPESWIPLRNQELYVPEDELMPLPEGRYYIFQLIGLSAVDAENRALGKLVDVLQTGSNDVYVFKDQAGRELLIPAIEQYVHEIDLKKGQIRISLPEYW